MTQYVLWNPDIEWLGKDNPDYMCEIAFAKELGINLFEPEETFTFSGMDYMIIQDPRKKVVLKHWRNHAEINYPKEDLSWADLLILYTNDVIEGPWEKYCQAVEEQFNCKKFICITDGVYKLTDYPKDRVYQNHEHHSNKIINFCQFEEWNTTPPKPKVFDALIGSIDENKKPHRYFLASNLLQQKLFNKTFINTWGAFNFRSPELIHLDDTGSVANYRNSTVYSDHFKNGRSMSFSIPIELYKRSWYSIVAETMAEQSNYITEKIAKPLFEKRIFVVFGAQGVLRRLHELGYQTFDSVIDESYDREPDNLKRYNMAFAQVLKLAKADHQEIYNKLATVSEHNHSWMVDGQRPRLQGLKDFLDMHINKL